jgi:hypothetical protein
MTSWAHATKQIRSEDETNSSTAGAIAIKFLMACTADSQVVNVWPGTAPGSENWTHKEISAENTLIGTVVFNVVTPTVTAYLNSIRG